MDADLENRRSLQQEVRHLFARYRAGEMELVQLANRLTHLNFDARFTQDVANSDVHLSRIIEDMGPDLEVEPRQTIVDEIALEIERFSL